MKVRFDMRGYTNLFTNTVAIPDHNRLVVKKVFPFGSVTCGQNCCMLFSKGNNDEA